MKKVIFILVILMVFVSSVCIAKIMIDTTMRIGKKKTGDTPPVEQYTITIETGATWTLETGDSVTYQ